MVSLVEPLFNKTKRQYQSSPHTHTHTNSNSQKDKIQPNTQQIQVCNKNELLSKYGCCPITIATKSSRNQTTFVILDSNLIWAHPKKKKKTFYEILNKTMGFRWFLDLQGNVIMKYLSKKNWREVENRMVVTTGDDSETLDQRCRELGLVVRGSELG